MIRQATKPNLLAQAGYSPCSSFGSWHWLGSPGIEWNGEFNKSDTLFFDDNQVWPGTCVENVRWSSRGGGGCYLACACAKGLQSVLSVCQSSEKLRSEYRQADSSIDIVTCVPHRKHSDSLLSAFPAVSS